MTRTTPQETNRTLTRRERTFVEQVWEHYKRAGRNWLPWRNLSADRRGHVDPYHILVSEVMCQQTQVDRVAPKYRVFLETFPTLESLATAPLGDVLRLWQGLGYNRRAKMLHACAQELCASTNGIFPQSTSELETLPGVGPYTARAVMVFAYNKAVPLIETNIRSAYLYHFFKNRTAIPDTEIVRSIERTMERDRPREWFSALMDHGAYIKKTFGNQNTRSKTYTKQTPFTGSDREIRGSILRALSESQRTRGSLVRLLPFEKKRLQLQLKRLQYEGMIEYTQNVYRLPR